MNTKGMEFTNTFRLECRRMRWKQWIGLFSILVITELLPLSSAAETVPMENVLVAAHTAYAAGISASVSGCPSRSVSTGEFPTKAEALAALLPLKLDFSDCTVSGHSVFYLYFKADSNPDNYQIWWYLKGNFISDFLNATWPIGAIKYPATYKKQCPIPATRPNVPYTPDPNGLTCSRQDTLTITLSGSTEVEPWNEVTDADHKKATLQYTATVMDASKQPAQPAPNVEVTITTEVDEYSGGHIHNTDRPKGKLAIPSDPIKDGKEKITGKTDINGVYSFVFGAEEASGTHTLTAKCTGCQAPATAPVNVKVDGLQPIPATPFLYSLQLPNRDTNHPATFFLTKASIEKLRLVALYYYMTTYKLPKNGVIPDLVLNDASLEWGGVLDCYLTCNSAQYPSTPWHKHHIEHRRGSTVDVKANGSPGTIVYDKVFRSWAKKFGVVVGDLHGSGSGLHYHLRLNNGAKE